MQALVPQVAAILEGTGQKPMTVFVPPSADLHALMDRVADGQVSEAAARTVVLAHFVGQHMTADDLLAMSGGTLRTLAGVTVPVDMSVQGDVQTLFVNNVEVRAPVFSSERWVNDHLYVSDPFTPHAASCPCLIGCAVATPVLQNALWVGKGVLLLLSKSAWCGFASIAIFPLPKRVYRWCTSPNIPQLYPRMSHACR